LLSIFGARKTIGLEYLSVVDYLTMNLAVLIENLNVTDRQIDEQTMGHTI